MKLSDTTLGWGLMAAAVLVVIAMGVAWYATRARRSSADADSWERSEERRRRKEAVYGIASYTLLFCCAAVAAALSFHGLVGFGRQNLNLSGGWEYLVPFGLDGAAMFCSVLAVREASHGDAALGSRILVWLFAGAAAWFNWVHAPRGGPHAGAPQFFAGMSLSAAVLFDRALKQTRRAALREQGLVPRPLPQVRIVRWLRAPRETYAAWSLMLLEGIRSLDEAVDEVREDKRREEAERTRRRDADRRERAHLKALRSQGRLWQRGGGRQVAMEQGASGNWPSGAAVLAAAADEEDGDRRDREPAIADPEQALEHVDRGADAENVRPLPGRERAGEPERGRTVDLTAEDDTTTLPRLDSLERKLKDLEQQFN